MQARVACEIQAWGSFEQLSGAQPSAWIGAWSWDPLKLMRRHPPHHLSPAWAKHPAGLDPEAGLGRSKSPQQRSVQAGKPVKASVTNNPPRLRGNEIAPDSRRDVMVGRANSR